MESILAETCMHTQGRILRYNKYGSEPGKATWLAKGNSEEMPHVSDSNCQKGATLWVCPCVYLQILYSFPPNKYFACFTTFCLCGNSFSAKSKGPGPCHCLETRIRLSHCRDPTRNFWPGTKSLLQVTAGRDHSFSVLLSFLMTLSKVTARTNFHRLAGLWTTDIYFSQFWRLGSPRSRH